MSFFLFTCVLAHSFLGVFISASTAQCQPSETTITSAKTEKKCIQAADCQAKLEEFYRKKFEKDIDAGNTLFHPRGGYDRNFEVFGPFIVRFDAAAYKTWRYPSEAVNKGLAGITPARITFNRKGKIVNVQVLESSGSKILDNEVIRAMKEIGQVQGFPRSYSKAEFHLITFFEYFSGLCKQDAH